MVSQDHSYMMVVSSDTVNIYNCKNYYVVQSLSIDNNKGVNFVNVDKIQFISNDQKVLLYYKHKY